MTRQIQLRILPDGKVQAEVLGFRGKKCTDYIAILEALLDAEAVDSDYRPEYWLSETETTPVRQEEKEAAREEQQTTTAETLPPGVISVADAAVIADAAATAAVAEAAANAAKVKLVSSAAGLAINLFLNSGD
jgi:hypothetical protein